jgi:Icc-related predicted phosphoesterase
MKILVIGDLHGRKPKITSKDFDCIVQIGDICDDRKLSPYWRLWFHLLKELGDDASDAEELILSDVGEEGYKKLERDSLIEGRKILEYLNSFGKPVFFIPGNWDQSFGETSVKNPEVSNYAYYKSWFERFLGNESNPKLVKGLKNVFDCQFKKHEFRGINFIGYGLSNNKERITEKPKKKLAKLEINKLDKIYFKIIDRLSSLYNKKSRGFPVIFLSHNIPYDTKLDIIKDKKSYAYKKHLGSYVAKKFCEKHQPLVCIGGHVHEGRGQDKIGKTILINPGFGENALVMLDIDENKGKIMKIKFLGSK